MPNLQYEIIKKKFSEIKGLVKIPSFQRGLVWNDTKKKNFISTLKQGLPIGVLLFSKDATDEDKYLVIDGLQRFSTMIDYSKNPFSYFSEEEITDNLIHDIIATNSQLFITFNNSTDIAKNKVVSQVRTIIKETISNNPENLNNQRLAKNAARKAMQEIALLNNEDYRDGIEDKLFEIIQDFENNSSIDDVEIPIILFLGSDDDLADIYQKLNQEGVKLSKYDVFAATWSGYSITVHDDEFIEHIIKKYTKSEEDSGLSISNFNEDDLRQSGELTIFEYAYGLGKELQNKCKNLFAKSDDKIDGLSFLILSEIFNVKYSEMGKLASEIVRYSNVLDFAELKNVIVKICREVEDSLGSFIIAPTQKKVPLACHADFQLASFITVLFKIRYEISFESGLHDRGARSREYQNIKKHIPLHYIYDIIRSAWSNSSDSKLESMLEDPHNCRYTSPVDKNTFKTDIITWLKEGNEKSTQKNVSKESKLFWNYYLRKVVPDPSINNKGFDVEHIVPQKKIESILLNNGINVPMSTTCNLCYLPLGDNRGKNDKTFYEKYDEDDERAIQIDPEKLELYVYPTREELAFLSSDEGLTKENYLNFINRRINTIANKFINAFYS